ncbi:hypothetical protein N7462_010025 [Penicillium macrosclerotiorum]|uniref:uncharacterized protein n=1 Tax=Penicillium macrosclerotiorum TaxID=303699 RepID=UPI002547CC5C|nr:uncharacterized protein N7462_010025 [Penicillium macrosclerotiorum]KAJ5668955.1 hypothetical protein N7462_010025 [Penicillium macrosclerotiorum]
MILEATTSGAESTPGDPNISWPIERLSSSVQPTPAEWHPSFAAHHGRSASPSSASSTSNNTPELDQSNYPTGRKSLAGISLRAFALGTTLGLSTSLTILLTTLSPTPLWRIPFFLAALSLFHFLEFFVTARHNTPYADVKAFLLSSNGWAYNAAHGSALLECLAAQYFWPAPIAGAGLARLALAAGLVLVCVGQVVRSLAMAQAAGNFNHHVQSTHQAGHVLVRTGLYGYLRHPSYFGFFWWGLGTQLVLGNVVCFMAYAAVLWRFFCDPDQA